ncbi:hypothetical protein BRO54_3382 [Geobacillus proteiniphilus]|uniref:Uncharacterized protein n=1 Tax=Geobacillus proteiniphilus TaxID=860353 RepID=A0A1Q5SMQ9_9BACL|nr:hypothetical protein BRO54_3382 [Geobacillus proteiniphilus]
MPSGTRKRRERATKNNKMVRGEKGTSAIAPAFLFCTEKPDS